MWRYMPAANATLHPHGSHIKTLCKIAAPHRTRQVCPYLKGALMVLYLIYLIPYRQSPPVASQVVNAVCLRTPSHAITRKSITAFSRLYFCFPPPRRAPHCHRKNTALPTAHKKMAANPPAAYCTEKIYNMPRPIFAAILLSFPTRAPHNVWDTLEHKVFM